jgi:hypothetical protein
VEGSLSGPFRKGMNNIMLSPKMQRSIRINDSQILMLAEKARFDNAMAGYLHKKSNGAGKWTRRYFILFQVEFKINGVKEIKLKKSGAD